MTKTWNVPKAEALIHDLYQLTVLLHGLPQGESFAKQVLSSVMPEDRRDAAIAATKEMAAIRYNTPENKSGYFLNRISSGKTKYAVWTDPTEEHPNGEFVGEYDTEDEAAEHMTEDTSMVEFDPDEYWAVLDAKGHNATQMLYPTQIRAMAFLYCIARPKAWMSYLKKEDWEVFGWETENYTEGDNNG